MASHLAVAVPPAIVLGALVVGVNQRALQLQAQQLHLSVANQLRIELSTRVQASVMVLDQAERILGMRSVPIEDRKSMLKALVADNRVPFLALYTPDGDLDSLFRGPGPALMNGRGALPRALRQEAQERGWALGDVSFFGGAGDAPLIVPWERQGELLGFIGARFFLEPLNQAARQMAERYLGPSGELDLIDGDGTYVVSSVVGRVSHQAGPASPFMGLQGRAREGAVAVEIGRALSFVDERQEPRLGAIVSAPELRWMIGSSRSEAVAFASIVDVKRRTLALAIVAALAAAVAALLLARILSAPLRELSAQLRDCARGGFEGVVSVMGYAELQRLSSTFNTVLQELGQHRRRLRSETQMRVRLARFLSPTALHQLFTGEASEEKPAAVQEMSVIYADISAVSDLSLRLEEAQLVRLLGEFFEEVCEVIEQQGGRVDRYSGDAIIGVFAASLVQRAPRVAFDAAAGVLQTARDISARWQDQIGAPFDASVGLVTGQGGLLNHDGQEISVTGRLVERAASLQSSAKPGAMLIDEQTRSALDGTLGSTTPLLGPTLHDQKVFLVELGKDEEVRG